MLAQFSSQGPFRVSIDPQQVAQLRSAVQDLIDGMGRREQECGKTVPKLDGFLRRECDRPLVITQLPPVTTQPPAPAGQDAEPGKRPWTWLWPWRRAGWFAR
jgi:hypothetical protein